jgi:hypothetical protein
VRPGAALLLVATVALIGGCGGSPGGQPGPAGPPAVDSTAPAGAPATAPSGAPRSAAPRTTVPVVVRDGPCPYFGTGYAQQTIGQHLARTTVTSTRPYPGCTLYRPDGGKAIDIQVLAYPSALAAQRRAVSVLGPSANPTEVGDRGAVLVVADGTRLAASKGRYLVAVYINQQSSLQAHDVAIAVVNKIH